MSLQLMLTILIIGLVGEFISLDETGASPYNYYYII